MSKVLKWAQNTTQGKLSISKSNNNGTIGEKKWIHPPEALQKGHIAYLVKFLGNTVVDQPKGIEVVKEGIRKLQFSQQLKKSESGGAKMKKLELTISIDGVAIQEPKTHTILHQFPLHRISYCADDKGEKKYFSFIAKQPNQDNDADEKHECFVFISDKLAEEITLTIGQAFELAYKRFLETSGKDLESHRRAVLTQQKIKRLEYENNVYKQRLLDVSKFASCRGDLDAYMRKHEIKNILEVVLPLSVSGSEQQNGQSEHHSATDSTSNQLLDLDTELNGTNAPPVPPRNFDNQPIVGTKLQNLLLNDLEEDDDDFDPRGFENSHNSSHSVVNGNGIINMNAANPNSPPLLAPPPKAAKRNNINNNDSPVRTFGQELFATSANSFGQPLGGKPSDPFEMGDFNAPTSPSSQFESDIGMLDKRIMEMKTGFSRGISFGNEDFSLESLDPLRN